MPSEEPHLPDRKIFTLQEVVVLLGGWDTAQKAADIIGGTDGGEESIWANTAYGNKE